MYRKGCQSLVKKMLKEAGYQESSAGSQRMKRMMMRRSILENCPGAGDYDLTIEEKGYRTDDEDVL